MFKRFDRETESLGSAWGLTSTTTKIWPLSENLRPLRIDEFGLWRERHALVSRKSRKALCFWLYFDRGDEALVIAWQGGGGLLSVSEISVTGAPNPIVEKAAILEMQGYLRGQMDLDQAA